MSELINDGGPAFAKTGIYAMDSQRGMTLRDWFAGQALSGLASTPLPKGSSLEDGLALIGTASYKIADAMIKAREVKS